VSLQDLLLNFPHWLCTLSGTSLNSLVQLAESSATWLTATLAWSHGIAHSQGSEENLELLVNLMSCSGGTCLVYRPRAGPLFSLAETMFLWHHTPRAAQAVGRAQALEPEDLDSRPNSSASNCETYFTVINLFPHLKT
jgi:hypothetical protein